LSKNAENCQKNIDPYFDGIKFSNTNKNCPNGGHYKQGLAP
jgi:hypothetical protein